MNLESERRLLRELSESYATGGGSRSILRENPYRYGGRSRASRATGSVSFNEQTLHNQNQRNKVNTIYNDIEFFLRNVSIFRNEQVRFEKQIKQFMKELSPYIKDKNPKKVKLSQPPSDIWELELLQTVCFYILLKYDIDMKYLGVFSMFYTVLFENPKQKFRLWIQNTLNQLDDEYIQNNLPPEMEIIKDIGRSKVNEYAKQLGIVIDSKNVKFEKNKNKNDEEKEMMETLKAIMNYNRNL